MFTFTVAMLQLRSYGNDIDANLIAGEDACRRAASMGADLALFQEMWSIGYTPCPTDPDGAEQWRDLAMTVDGEFVRKYQAIARELGMAIAITYLERHESGPRNAVSVIDRAGDVVLQYAKVHTCDFGTEAVLTPGRSFDVGTLRTRNGDVMVGSMICYDREFPESVRMLMLKGAEIVLVPNACELELNRIAQIRTRAFENMVGIAVTNYPAPQCNGHSIAFDGMAFDEHERSRDTLLVEASEAEDIVLARFDIDALREYRIREAWGDAYRKPATYAGLTDGPVYETFRRKDSRR